MVKNVKLFNVLIHIMFNYDIYNEQLVHDIGYAIEIYFFLFNER